MQESCCQHRLMPFYARLRRECPAASLRPSSGSGRGGDNVGADRAAPQHGLKMGGLGCDNDLNRGQV
jgi:hypothetical protein